jgi:hypothetical protein
MSENIKMVMALNDPFMCWTDPDAKVNSWVNPDGVALLLTTATKGATNQVLRRFRTKMIDPDNKGRDRAPLEGEKYIDAFFCTLGGVNFEFALFEYISSKGAS